MSLARSLLLLLLLAVTAIIGCATPGENEVSSIPWNRPERWEGMGALGGFGFGPSRE
ncbi:MAG: hypothetical protein N3B01_08205 [Verrucomicrobiae bacterium]|nr:hypothetical protein [Verrucomicrobiae bacterium]